MCRHNFVGVVQIPVGGNSYRLGYRNFHVRRGNRPAVHPFFPSGRIGRIPRRRSRRGPSRQHPDLVRCQRRIIRKMPDPFIGKPRRHPFFPRRVGNGPRIRPRLGIILKRHRRNPSRPMAHLTMLLDHRHRILVKSRCIGVRGCSLCCRGRDRQRQQTREHSC